MKMASTNCTRWWKICMFRIYAICTYIYVRSVSYVRFVSKENLRKKIYVHISYELSAHERNVRRCQRVLEHSNVALGARLGASRPSGRTFTVIQTQFKEVGILEPQLCAYLLPTVAITGVIQQHLRQPLDEWCWDVRRNQQHCVAEAPVLCVSQRIRRT